MVWRRNGVVPNRLSRNFCFAVLGAEGAVQRFARRHDPAFGTGAGWDDEGDDRNQESGACPSR